MVDLGERFLPYPLKISEIRNRLVQLSKTSDRGDEYKPMIKQVDLIDGVFNFGTISKNYLDKLYEDARKHAVAKMGFVFPFPNFAFRYSHEENGQALGMTLVNFQHKDASGSYNLMMCFSHKQNGSMKIIGGDIQADIPNPSLHHFRSINPNDTIEETRLIYRLVVVPIFAFCLVLNTKNIPKITEIPSPKLQAKRAKEGLPPLPYTTNVNLNAYMIARNNTESGNTGTHTRPRPHLRRAHLRTIMRGEELVTIPVQQCMVNWDGELPLMREEYKVKTTNLEK